MLLCVCSLLLFHPSLFSCIARLILSNVRYLDVLYEPAQWTQLLTDGIGALMCESLKHECITALAEIIDPAQHNDIAQWLAELMQESASMMLPVLDTLSNLSLSAELAQRINSEVLDRLSSAKTEQLPVLIKYILQTCDKADMADTWSKLRKRVNSFIIFTSATVRNERGVPQHSHSAAATDAAVLTMDAIRNCIRFKPEVATEYLKVLQAITAQVCTHCWIVIRAVAHVRSRAVAHFFRAVSLTMDARCCYCCDIVCFNSMNIRSWTFGC